MSWGKPTCRDTEPWCKLHSMKAKNTRFSTNSQGPCRGTHKISKASDNTTRIFSRNPGDPCPSILSRNSPKVFTRTFPRPDRISTQGSLTQTHKVSVQGLRTRVNYPQGPKKCTAPQEERSNTKSTQKGLRKLYTAPQRELSSRYKNVERVGGAKVKSTPCHNDTTRHAQNGCVVARANVARDTNMKLEK